VVNQTTLLMNETVEIIDYFRSVYRRKYGAAEGDAHVGGSGKKDTLCYATQVNQDALNQALAEPLDAAFVIGGQNSSNTTSSSGSASKPSVRAPISSSRRRTPQPG